MSRKSHNTRRIDYFKSENLEYMYIQNVATGHVLMPKDLLEDAGTPVIARTPHPNFGDSQLWAFVRLPGFAADECVLLNKASGRVINVYQNREFSSFTIDDPVSRDGEAWQRKLQAFTYDSATKLLRSKVLPDRALMETAVGSELLLRDPIDSSPNQQWRMIRDVLHSPTQFFIEHRKTNGLLTPRQGKLTSGTPLAVEQENVNYPGSQLWTWSGNGYIGNPAAAMVADVYHKKPADGVVIDTIKPQDSPDGTDNQTWTLTTDGRIKSDLGDWFLSRNPQNGNTLLVKGSDKRDVSEEEWTVRRAVSPQPVSQARAVQLSGNQFFSLNKDAGPTFDDFTVESWVRTTSGGPIITSRGVSTKTAALALTVQQDGRVIFRTTGGSASLDTWRTSQITTIATNATDGEWHHLAATRQGTSLAVYLDGVLVDNEAVITPDGTFGRPPKQQIQFATIAPDSGITSPANLVGSLADIRIWNRALDSTEVPAGMHHKISDLDQSLLGHWDFRNDSGRDFSLNFRDAEPTGDPSFVDSDIEVVSQGNFYLVTQALLMEDYTSNPDGYSKPGEIEGYRVTITIRDYNDQGTPGFLTLKLNNTDVSKTAVLHFSDSTTATLNSKNSTLTLPTDSQGVLSFTIDAEKKLTCPSLRVQADFQSDGSWLVIAPDSQVHSVLASISGDNLRGYTADGTPIPDRDVSSAPLAHSSAAEADGAASAINQVMSAATQPNAQATIQQTRALTDLVLAPSVRPYVPRYQMAALVSAVHDPKSDAIATHHVDRDVPVARLINPANAEHAHWSYDFNSFTSHTAQEAAIQVENLGQRLSYVTEDGGYTRGIINKLTPGMVLGTSMPVITDHEFQTISEENILTTTGGVEGWLKKHIQDAKRLLVTTVSTLVKDENNVETEVKHLVVTAIKETGDAAYAVLQAAEHAVDVVSGILARLKCDVAKVVSFLKSLFNWTDVISTQRVIYTYITNLESFLTNVLQDAFGKAGKELNSFAQTINKEIDGWRKKLIEVGGQNELKKNSSPPPGDQRSNYGRTLTSASVTKSGSARSAQAAASAGGIDLSVIEPVALQTAEDWLRAAASTWAELPGQIASSPVGRVHDMRSFFLDGLELLLSTVEALVDALVGSVIDVVEVMQNRVSAIIRVLYEVGTQEFRIPFLTPFYEHIVMAKNPNPAAKKLTTIGLISLLAAMPVTFGYKITHKEKAPISVAEADQFEKIPPSEYTWLHNPFTTRNVATASQDVNGIPAALPTFLACGSGIIQCIGSLISDMFLWEQATATPIRIGNQRKFTVSKNAIDAVCVAFSLVGCVVGLLASILSVIQAYSNGALVGILTLGCCVLLALTTFTSIAATVRGGDELKSSAAEYDAVANFMAGAVGGIFKIPLIIMSDSKLSDWLQFVSGELQCIFGQMMQMVKMTWMRAPDAEVRDGGGFVLVVGCDGIGGGVTSVLNGGAGAAILTGK